MVKVTQGSHASADESYWRYKGYHEDAPKGADVQLLTCGGQQVRGVWRDDGSVVAWAPLIQRDKKIERQLGIKI